MNSHSTALPIEKLLVGLTLRPAGSFSPLFICFTQQPLLLTYAFAPGAKVEQSVSWEFDAFLG